MTTKTVYVASDGKEFSAEENCKLYEECIKRRTSIEESAEEVTIRILRNEMDALNAGINLLKSNAKYGNTLSRLTQDFIAKRAEYKRVLKMTDFSVKSMIALDKILHAACEAYEKWDNAVGRLQMLRTQFAPRRKQWHDKGYGFPTFK